MKKSSSFSNSQGLEPHYQMVGLVPYSGHSLWGGVLRLCRGAVGVIYSPHPNPQSFKRRTMSPLIETMLVLVSKLIVQLLVTLQLTDEYE